MSQFCIDIAIDVKTSKYSGSGCHRRILSDKYILSRRKYSNTTFMFRATQIHSTIEFNYPACVVQSHYLRLDCGCSSKQ